MKTGFVYWHPYIYKLIMRMLYKMDLSSRNNIIANLLPDNVSVVDVCCGDCYIANSLLNKGIRYTGLDINQKFLVMATKKNIEARYCNILKHPIPKADYIIMLGSLYQFFPGHRSVLDKIFGSALKGVIIAEPVENLASSKNPILRYFSALATAIDSRKFYHRFSRKELLDLFYEYNPTSIKETPYGKEMIAFFLKNS